MTKEEFKILAKGMKAVYTQQNFLPDADALNIWYTLLQDLDYMIAQAAIQKHMITSKFPPTIADIREQAAAVSYGEKPLWSDGWEKAVRAIKRYGSYNPSAALAEMDEITRKTVERLGYRELCLSENIMADRANFRMIFEQLADREKEAQKIPYTLSTLIEGVQRKGIGYEEHKRISASNQED